MAQTKLTLTERDKKLITYVGSIVIVIFFALILIKPAIENHQVLDQRDTELKEQVSHAKDDALKASLREQARANYATVAKKLTGYYTDVDSAVVDQITTEIATNYGVGVYSLRIELPKEFATSAPYVPVPPDSKTSKNNVEPTQLFGIYDNRAVVTFYGDYDALQGLINGICTNDWPGVQINNFRWERYYRNAIEITDEWRLTTTLSFYSYKDER